MELACKREINAEVVVVGGGTAGVFAAISAARTGAKTVLIEKNSILGGTMTVAGVNFPGLFFAWGRQIIDGPCWESVMRTVELGGAKLPEITFKPERHWFEQIKLNKFVYTAVVFEMCREAGVEVICNAMVSAVVETECEIKVIVTDKNGLVAINAKTAVDSTGDGNLAGMTGFALEKSREQQPGTLQNHIWGYDVSNVSKTEFAEKFEKADFPAYITADKLYGYLSGHKIDMHIRCADADTSKGKTALDTEAFAEMLKVYRFYRSIKGLENLEIDYVASETGVRETNRIVGEGRVTAEEYISGHFYPDSVCYAFYPIDRHVMNGIEKVYHEENVVAKVPYSALVPKGSKRLVCAGRCISSDEYANSAVRVEAVCMATGQAAGCGAALAALQNVGVYEISYRDLCGALESIGGIVPKKEG